MDKTIGDEVMQVKRVFLRLLVILLSMSALYLEALAEEVETLDEVSIVGNSELPSVNFNLAWRLPSVQNREEQSLPKDLPGILDSIEPTRLQKQIHFSRFLEVDIPRFQAP